MRVRVEPASGTATERFEYVHRDHLGSVDRVTDGTGAAVATLSAASFDPFGGRRDAGWSADESAATAANVLALQDERFSRGFTDHEGLHRTGFVHMNGRVFDPRIGRFLQPDPVVSAPDTAQGHNRYAYVGNAPLSATDPSGLVPVGGYVGRTGGNADYGPLFGSLMNDLWSAGGFETFNLSTFDAVITKGMDPVEFDHYLRTGVDLRRLAQTARGEWLFPEGDDRGNNRDAYGLIITNGILETREDFQNRVTELGALGYYDPTDGFFGDVLQAIFQKFFPSTDWMARRLAEYLATREDAVTIEGYSGGTLTVVNALRRLDRRNRFAVTLHSPVVSYARAWLAARGVNYNQPWRDVSNLLAPSLNPVKFGSGLLDLFCGFCIHRGNNL